MFRPRTTFLVSAITLIALYIFFVVLPVSKGYESFILFAANLINKQQRVAAIKAAFPPLRFYLIQKIVFVIGFILSSVFAAAIIHPRRYSNYVYRIISPLKNSWINNVRVFKALSPAAKLIFGFTIIYLIVQSVYYMWRLPFIHDEAYTISNFIIPGPLASITFYPYPNNHIFFSLFSYPFSLLPLKPEIAFRLPSLIAVVISCIVFFRVLLLLVPAITASLGIIVFTCMLPVMNYAIFARGYCLVFLFSSLSVFSLFRIIQTGSRYHNSSLIIFSVFGLYTVPSYTYPFAIIFAMYFAYGIISKQTKVVGHAIIGGFICVSCALILYLPVIITLGGWHNFVKVVYIGYDDSAPLSRLIEFIQFVYSIQFFEQSFLIKVFFLFVVLSALVPVKKMIAGKIALIDSIFFSLCLLGFLAPVLSFIIQRKMVAPRTHSYAAIFFAGYSVIALKLSFSNKLRQYVYAGFTVMMVILNVGFAHTSGLLKGEEYVGRTADLFAKKMLETKGGNEVCYTFDMFYLADIQLKYAIAKSQLTVFQSQAGSPSTAPFDFKNNYDWVITLKEELTLNKDSLSALYVPVLSRDDAVLWKRRM